MAVSRFDSVLDPQSPLQGDERWELVQRIVTNPIFTGSPALQSFLLYVTEHTLLGQTDEVKEQAIGSSVLGRRADYDPAVDNIVRVRARQLRQKLGQYFLTDGSGERLILTIPKGGYSPVFEARPEENPAAVSLSVAEEPKVLKSSRKWPGIPWIVASFMAVLFLTAWLRPVHWGPSPDRRIWSQIFGKNRAETLLVLGDSGVALWQDLTHRNLSLADYLGTKYLESQGGFTEVSRRRFTSLADVNLATRIVPLAQSMGAAVKIRLARNIDVRDFQSGNVILLGSRRANPWVELFEPRLHYVWDYDFTAKRSFFRNRSPARGESAVLRPAPGAIESYAMIAMLPNFSNTGRVLLIEGLSMEGTDAAGGFLLNPQTSGELARRVTAELGDPRIPFEALLELTPVAGGSANTRLVSVRRL